MKIKIFFSYSRVDRDFLNDVIARLGHDYAIVDNYVLEDGEEVWPEIRKAIEGSSHFVFLVTVKQVPTITQKTEKDTLHLAH